MCRSYKTARFGDNSLSFFTNHMFSGVFIHSRFFWKYDFPKNNCFPVFLKLLFWLIFSAAALKLCRCFVPLFTPTAHFHRKLTVAHVTLFCMPLFASEKQLDGCFTWLLRADLNISLRDHISNKELYGDLPPISTSLQICRLKFIAHCWRSKNETVSQLLLWDPKPGSPSRERPATIFILGSCICHGQQTGMGQTCKITAGAPK